jgi:hypothetical protein
MMIAMMVIITMIAIIVFVHKNRFDIARLMARTSFVNGKIDEYEMTRRLRRISRLEEIEG